MSRRGMTRWVVLLLLTTILLAGCSGAASVEGDAMETDTTNENYVAVEVSEAEVRSLANEATLNGRVFSENEVMVLPRTPGIVERVNVKLGDTVRKDQVLFVFEQDDILTAIKQAEEGVNAAQKGTEQAQNGIEAAQRQYEGVKDQYDNLLSTLERTQRLYEAGAVPRTQLEDIERNVTDLSRNVEGAKSQITQAEISYQQALGQLRQAEIGLDQARSNLNHTAVKAPASGVITSLDVRVGQPASNAQPAAIIVDVNDLYIQLDVPENMINQFRRGQEVNVSVPAANIRDTKASVGLVSAAADPRTQLYPVRINLDNRDGQIRPGMTGEVQVDMDQTGETLIIRSRAILDRDNETLVYVVENDRAVERKVTIGLDTGEYAEIIEGVNEGEEVIIRGQHYVTDGTQVKVVRSE